MAIVLLVTVVIAWSVFINIISRALIGDGEGSFTKGVQAVGIGFVLALSWPIVVLVYGIYLLIRAPRSTE